MKHVNIFLANLFASIIQIALFGVAYTLAVLAFFAAAEQWGYLISALLIPIYLVGCAFFYVVELFIIRFLIMRPRIGSYSLGSGQHFLYQLNHNIFGHVVNPVFPPLALLYQSSSILRVFILKAMGANVKFSASIASSARIHDPFLVTIGTKATIGRDTQLFCFAVESGKAMIRKIFVGPKAHISSASLLFPGTEIGEGSVLGMGSSTRNDMKIQSYELWVGSPASLLSRLTRPLLYTSSQRADKPERERHPRRDFSPRREGGRPGRRDFRDRGERGDRGRRPGRFQRSHRDDRGRSRPRHDGPSSHRQPPRQETSPHPPASSPSPSSNPSPSSGGEKPYIGPIDVSKSGSSGSESSSQRVSETGSQQSPAAKTGEDSKS